MKKLVVANWKMNPASPGQAWLLARNEDFKGVVIAPPFPFLPLISKILRKAKAGAQDVFWAEGGAYTGEVSSRQLRSLGADYVIVGHSERRALGETDEIINKKVKAALGEGLKVILCVGEPWIIRQKGIAAAKTFVKNQLQKDLRGIRNKELGIRNLVIAYEPVWAIGTGRADKPKETVEMVSFIKQSLVISHKSPVRVLYGGSVTAKNAKHFLSQKDIDGALVGGASLRPEEFKKIIESAP